MKRIIACILAASITLSISGCSAASSSSGESSNPSTSKMATSGSSGAIGNLSEPSSIQSTEAESADTAQPTNSASLFAPEEWPVNEITADVPVPSFSADVCSVFDGSSITSVDYDKVPESEIAEYVEQLKAAGFIAYASESKSSSSYSYSAWNDEDIANATGVMLNYSNDGSLHLSMS